MTNNVAPASSACSSSSANVLRHNLTTPLNFNNLEHDCDSLHSCIHNTLKKSNMHRLSNGNLTQNGLIMMHGSTNPYNVICDTVNDSMNRRQMSSSQTNVNSPLSHEFLIMNQQALDNLHDTSIDGSVYENDGTRYTQIGASNDININNISSLLNSNMPLKNSLNQSLKNLHSSLNRKQPSLRRLNQLLTSEQKLAPVFENFNADQFKKPVFDMSSSVYNCEDGDGSKQRMLRSWTPDNENLKFSVAKPMESTMQKTNSSSHLFGPMDNSSILEETLAIYNKAVNMNRSSSNINGNCSRLNYNENGAIYESSGSRKASSQSAENIISGELQLATSGNSITNYELLDFNLKSTLARLNAQASAKPESMESLKNGGSAKLIKMRRNEDLKPPSDTPLGDKNNSYKLAVRPKLSEIFNEVSEKSEGEKSPSNVYEAIGMKRFLNSENKANQDAKVSDNESNNAETNAPNSYIPLRSIQKTPIQSGMSIGATSNVHVLNTKNNTIEQSQVSAHVQALMVNQDTDSGRHSMTDSPCSLPPNDSVNQKTQNDTQKTANLKANNVAGTFTSKCTLSSGTAVTISQTKQKLHQKSSGAADADDNDVNGKRKSLNVNMMMVSSSSNATSSNRDVNDKQSRSVSRGRVNSSSRKSSEL